jgi:predicted AlkP superfamily pyrophosphatase or phosphodiesterase
MKPGGPYYWTQHNMDSFNNGLGRNDAVGEPALEFLSTPGRFFLFAHFADVDYDGHKYGENSKEYEAALISSDEWLGRFREKLEERGIAEETLVIVTADHGFDEGKKTHKDAPYVFLASNDPRISRTGDREDVAPTVLQALGIDWTKFEPELDGRPLFE